MISFLVFPGRRLRPRCYKVDAPGRDQLCPDTSGQHHELSLAVGTLGACGQNSIEIEVRRALNGATTTTATSEDSVD